MKGGQSISVDQLKKALNNQSIEIQKGDVVLFHTGWTDAKLVSNPEEWGGNIPGISPEVAKFLAKKDVLAVGADTYGLDVQPPVDPNDIHSGHTVLLKENGIYILENMNTGPLARDEAYKFLFILGQAKVRGAVQMIINPIAIR
jgi:kynurenine formamidase